MVLSQEEKETVARLRRKLTIHQTSEVTGLSATTIEKYSKGSRIKVKSNRSRLEIIHDLLFVVNESKVGVRKTRIMYRGNLSDEQLKKYMNLLIINKFIECNPEGIWKITRKGKKWFRLYEELMKSFKRS